MAKTVKKTGNTEMTPFDYAQYADEGFKDASKDDFLVPLIQVLQSNSPQVLEGGQDYVEGAKAGLLYNNVTHQCQKVIDVIPVMRERVFIEWVPRDDGGGLVDVHKPGSDVVLASKPDDDKPLLLISPDGNHLVDTRRFYCLVRYEDRWTNAVLPFSSTNIQVAKRWYTIMSENTFIDDAGNTRVYPLFSNLCQMTTRMRQNDKGSWYVFDPSVLGRVEDKPTIDLALKFRDALAQGVVTVKEDEQRTEESEDAGDF